MPTPTPLPFVTQIKAISATGTLATTNAPARQTVNIKTVATVAPPNTPLDIPAGTVTQFILPYIPPTANSPGNALPAGVVATVVATVYITTEDAAPVVNADGTLTWPN